jgi:hypothetical protein
MIIVGGVILGSWLIGKSIYVIVARDCVDLGCQSTSASPRSLPP